MSSGDTKVTTSMEKPIPVRITVHERATLYLGGGPSTWEAEADLLSLRAAWSIECVSGQPGLHRETLCVCVGWGDK